MGPIWIALMWLHWFQTMGIVPPTADSQFFTTSD